MPTLDHVYSKAERKQRHFAKIAAECTRASDAIACIKLHLEANTRNDWALRDAKRKLNDAEARIKGLVSEL